MQTTDQKEIERLRDALEEIRRVGTWCPEASDGQTVWRGEPRLTACAQIADRTFREGRQEGEMQTREDPLAILKDVLRFRRGEGEYNFTKLPKDQRESAYWDAWESLESRILQALSSRQEADPS